MRWNERFGGVLAFLIAAASDAAEEGGAGDWHARVHVTIADCMSLTRIERWDRDSARPQEWSWVVPARSVVVYPDVDQWRRIRDGIHIKEGGAGGHDPAVNRLYPIDALEREMVERMLEYIEREVAPGTWEGDRKMHVYNNSRLLVRHEPEVQAKIQQLLVAFRSVGQKHRCFPVPSGATLLWCGVAVCGGGFVRGKLVSPWEAGKLELGDHLVDPAAKGVYRSQSFIPEPLAGARFRWVYSEPAGAGAARSWRIPGVGLTSSGRGRIELAIEIEEATPIGAVRVQPATGFEIVRDSPCRLEISAALSENAFGDALSIDYDLLDRER